jgi:putative cardiolipin synthase
MHNKSFTADNQAAIIGGRNVGDEYFGATEGVLFADLDVFAVGPVVSAVSSDFDRYWASDSSYPAAQILPRLDRKGLDQLAARVERVTRDPRASAYVNAMRRTDFFRALLDGELDFEWADTRMVSDDPRKGLGKAKGLLTYQLAEIIGAPKQEVALVSSYFVPTAVGVDAFVEMAARGVTVRILTNSLDATDVAVVHAGYAKRRKDLLEAGITLYEMRRLSPETKRSKRTGAFSSSGSSLHAKTFAVDGERVFIGSFNFDPRSANLNTESGFVIDSPQFARQIIAAFDDIIPANAYEVRLSEDGRLYWLEQQGAVQVRHDSEPNTGFLKRNGVFLLSLLPIEWLL